MRLDLSFLQSQPDFSARALLTVEPLAPLSMVSKMPGSYYRALSAPTPFMLMGMLENALGWHFDQVCRDEILKDLSALHSEKIERSGVRFGSLLQWHLRFEVLKEPSVWRYDDLWIQHLRKRDADHINGSRHHDWKAISFANALASKAIEIANRGGLRKEPELIAQWVDGDKIHDSVPLSYYPRYYASNRVREYTVASGSYCCTLSTSKLISDLLQDALDNPQGALYLGANDGWVEASLETLS